MYVAFFFTFSHAFSVLLSWAFLGLAIVEFLPKTSGESGFLGLNVARGQEEANNGSSCGDAELHLLHGLNSLKEASCTTKVMRKRTRTVQ